VAALPRAIEFGRFPVPDVRSVLADGKGVPRPVGPGEAAVVDLPKVPTLLAHANVHHLSP
jgi:hypothetical protein